VFELIAQRLQLAYRVRYRALTRRMRKIVRNRYRYVRTYERVLPAQRARLGLRLLRAAAPLFELPPPQQAAGAASEVPFAVTEGGHTLTPPGQAAALSQLDVTQPEESVVRLASADGEDHSWLSFGGEALAAGNEAAGTPHEATLEARIQGTLSELLLTPSKSLLLTLHGRTQALAVARLASAAPQR
jgi:hypothetical protein